MHVVRKSPAFNHGHRAVAPDIMRVLRIVHCRLARASKEEKGQDERRGGQACSDRMSVPSRQNAERSLS